jgi:hypothetical protein
VVRVNLTSHPYFDHFDSPEASKALRGAHKRKLAAHSRWEDLTQDATRARAYSPRERFAVGDVIRHDKLGIGAVVNEVAGNKIEILFGDGSRVLVHGRG